ncbi:MAG: methyltransferase domain-containing protein [Chloroflexota bacterium]
MLWFAVALLIVAILIWWLLIRTEGVFLGRRMVIWLYDLYAKRYDNIVQHDDVEEHLHLAIPLMTRIAPNVSPLVLDVATGTGRMPLALCQHARFEGTIIGLDASGGMLKQAISKIDENHFEDYVTFLQGDGLSLPFPDNHFDVVTCMEALEFMPNPEQGLRELVRVLRPSGLLLTTRRIHEPLMLNRQWSQPKMLRTLQELGMTNVPFEAWQYDYEKVWAVKPTKPLDLQ